MTIQEFAALSEKAQDVYFAENGRYLDRRSTNTYHINLYAIDNFYVETP